MQCDAMRCVSGGVQVAVPDADAERLVPLTGHRFCDLLLDTVPDKCSLLCGVAFASHRVAFSSQLLSTDL